MTEKIWTAPIVRQNLYTQLTKCFGNLDSWEGTSYPKARESFKKFCDSFAITVGAKSGEAVAQQIRWAITTQTNVGREHMATYFGNKMAAIEAGFISKKDFPTRVRCQY